MKIKVPGKLILSGEHAVVYGQPALAMAVNRYVTISITKENKSQILLDLADLAYQKRLNVDTLRSIKERIKRKYQRFMAGEYSIRDVLQKPFELAQFALSFFAESQGLAAPHGFKIHLASTIPVGCGMGSSAATIVSVMRGMCDYLHLPLTQEALYKLALEAENTQHGQSSGIDLYVATNGGCHYFNKQEIVSRALPRLPMYFVNTGKPDSTTGECVTKAAIHFEQENLREAFGQVTQKMDHALQAEDNAALFTCVRENHALLTQIGVVPQKVQKFIAEITAAKGAAKICGAGAVKGEAAGIVWVLIEDEAGLRALCHQYGYELLDIQGVTHGAHVIADTHY